MDTKIGIGLKYLKRLGLCYCDDDRFELPQVEMPALTELHINGGTWNSRTRIIALLSWASVYAPKLTHFILGYQSRETAQIFTEELCKCGVSKRMNDLKSLVFFNCGLVEEDAKYIIFDLLLLYPTINALSFQDNKIESLQTIEETMASTRTPNDTLRVLDISDNPCFSNLVESSNSSDHSTAICLLKHFKRLTWLGHRKGTIKPTSEIDYLTKINYKVPKISNMFQRRKSARLIINNNSLQSILSVD